MAFAGNIYAFSDQDGINSFRIIVIVPASVLPHLPAPNHLLFIICYLKFGAMPPGRATGRSN